MATEIKKFDEVMVDIQPEVNIKVENEAVYEENEALYDAVEENVKRENVVDLDRLVRDANLLEPALLSATFGPMLNSKQSLWDVLSHKMNAMETTGVNKIGDCIQMVLNELRQLLIEVQGLLTSCCKETNRLVTFFKYSDQMLKSLSSDYFDGKAPYFDKHTLEPKDVFEIPAYYRTMMLISENPENEVKTQFDDSYIDYDDDGAPKKKKRKYTKRDPNKPTKPINKKPKDTIPLIKNRPNVKDVPIDLKMAMLKEDEERICKSRRRQYCKICTKGFSDSKRHDAHLENGDCPGKPNPKWHYTSGTAKRLFCIHPDCLGPDGKFDINNLATSFKSGGIAKDYYTHVMERHATPENCVFPCGSCPLKFPNTYVLKYHNEQCGDNFTCRFCGKGVSSKRGLVLHEASHNTSALKCPYCDHATSRKDLLKKHISGVHLNLRPEICQLCGKGFKTKNNIAKHMMDVHKHKFPCDICGKYVYTEEGVQVHKRIKHGIIP